jgi:hypothetical protein
VSEPTAPTAEPAPKADAHKRPAKRKGPPYSTQLLLSLITAVVITIATIAVVTAAIGPGPDWEELYDTRSERRDLIDERQDEREERLEEQEER